MEEASGFLRSINGQWISVLERVNLKQQEVDNQR